MAYKIVFGFIMIPYFLLYLKILGWAWDWVPHNTITDVLSLFIVIIVIIPLSALSADYTIKIIKSI